MWNKNSGEIKLQMSLYVSGSVKMSMATLDKYTHEYISSNTKITHQTRLDIKATSPSDRMTNRHG